MPWVNDCLWVGRHTKRGIVVMNRQVYDESDSIAVFFMDQNRVAICSRIIMENNICDNNISTADIQNAIEKYNIYEKKMGFDISNTDLFIEYKKVQEENARFLKSLGRSESSIRRRCADLPIRRNICWKCHKKIDSTSTWECVNCGWMLCTCGACGCGRQ